MGCPGNEAVALDGWIPVDEERGYITIHTTDGKACRAVGDYSKSFAMSLIRKEVKHHPEGIAVFVDDGFRFFPMSKVSHIAFRNDLAIMESQVHDVPGG